ncbi:S8 family serine peptidase [Cnuibacter physcomitrellae]|uniref:S8 family serine peptidase n=1 Tax=Cnuibacter physcomitrellae TaxID=1619308 RepID=UPI002175C02F|nr:S8 family serine peptidase [Cnuibacter physcomitrellae]MCS5496019.1 S8 family serine peptidase [Cnuibacter physcomitrellae]
MRGRQGRVALVAVLGVVGGLVLPAAGAQAVETGSGHALSDRLELIAGLPLASRASDGDGADAADVETQLDAHADDLGVAVDGPGSLQVIDGRIAVTVRYSAGPGDTDIERLSALAEVQASSSLFGLASALVAPSDLRAVADLPGVVGVDESPEAAVGSTEAPLAARPAESTAAAAAAATAAAAADCRIVPANLRAPLNVDLAASLHGVDGTGVVVGVISDSFATSTTAVTTPEEDVRNGVLPGPGNPCGYEQPVRVLADSKTPRSDEGRAMVQLVHQIAPGATVLFATDGTDEMTFAQAMNDLAAAGATVIVDDVMQFGDPVFQNGPLGWTVDRLAAQGVTYLSSAGNYTITGAAGTPSAGYSIGSWEGDYRPTPCPAEVAAVFPGEGISSGDCLDFDPGDGSDAYDRLQFSAPDSPERYATFIMNWSEPYQSARGAFRFGVVTPDGKADLVPAGTPGIPVVYVTDVVQKGELRFFVIRDTSAGSTAEVTPRVRLLYDARTQLQDAQWFLSQGGDVVGATLGGHAAAAGALAVAAAPASAPSAVEPFSSTGPTTVYSDYDPTRIPTSVPLPVPELRPKPDVTSVDAGYTDFFDDQVAEGRYVFSGTSAAAPAAAGVVALGRQAAPGADAAALRSALLETARPLDGTLPGFRATDLSGAGLIDADAFLDTLLADTPSPSPTAAVNPVATAELAATGSPAVVPTIVATGLALAALALGTIGLRRRRSAK